MRKLDLVEHAPQYSSQVCELFPALHQIVVRRLYRDDPDAGILAKYGSDPVDIDGRAQGQYERYLSILRLRFSDQVAGSLCSRRPDPALRFAMQLVNVARDDVPQ